MEWIVGIYFVVGIIAIIFCVFLALRGYHVSMFAGGFLGYIFSHYLSSLSGFIVSIITGAVAGGILGIAFRKLSTANEVVEELTSNTVAPNPPQIEKSMSDQIQDLIRIVLTAIVVVSAFTAWNMIYR